MAVETARMAIPYPDEFAARPGPMRRITTPEAVRLYATGMTAQQVGDRLGVSKPTVLARLREAGVTRTAGSVRAGDLSWVPQATAMYASGRMIADIAVAVGKSFATVQRRLSLAGYTARNVHHYRSFDGHENPNWSGGASFAPYSAAFTKKLKLKIRERDGFVCRLCALTESEHRRLYRAPRGEGGQALTIHHIDYDKSNCSEKNLVTLCHRCNPKMNKDRATWMKYWTAKMGVSGGE